MRIKTIDIFRSLTMFMMIFVNDIPSLKGVPHWLFHADTYEDMMGFSDLIFPAFLFCVGLSVPLAIEHRFSKGEDAIKVLSHIIRRTFALVVMGIFTLNCEKSVPGISSNIFMILVAIGLLLTWGKFQNMTRLISTTSHLAGTIILLSLLVYCDIQGKAFHTSWWGILGLIGWTYFVCAFAYLFTRSSKKKNLFVWFLVCLLALISSSKLIPHEYYLRTILLPFIPSQWTLHLLGLTGVVTTLIMQHYKNRSQEIRFIYFSIITAIGMFIAGYLCHPHWIISKNLGTPTWVFFSLSCFFSLLATIYYIVEIKGYQNLLSWISAAGTATLTCYLIPYLWYGFSWEMGVHILPYEWNFGIVGLFASLTFSFIIIRLTGLLKSIGFTTKI